jgi:branched-chain amino acid transport system substrate-binding protein
MINILLVLGNQEKVDKPINKSDIFSARTMGWKRYLAKIKTLNNKSLEELNETIRNNRFDIIIIIGHSNRKENESDGDIYINDYESNNRISIRDYDATFSSSVRQDLKLVILVGCCSDAAAKRLVREVNAPRVIAFKLPIDDALIRIFFTNLFNEWIKLDKPLSLEESLTETRRYLNQVNQTCPGAETIPILFSSVETVVKPPLMFSELIRKQTNQLARIYARLLAYLDWIPRLFRDNKLLSLFLLALFTAAIVSASQGGISFCPGKLICISNSKEPPGIPPNQITIQSSIGSEVLLKPASNDSYYGVKTQIAANFRSEGYPKVIEYTDIIKDKPERDRLYPAARAQDPERAWTLYNAQVLQNPRAGQVTVKLPVITSVEPDSYSTAIQATRGAVVAQREINDDLGKNIKILLEIISDGNNPDKALQVAKKLAQTNPRPIAVIGHYESDASMAAKDTYNQAEIVMMSPGSSVTELTGAGQFIFRTVPSSYQMAQRLAEYVQTKTSDKLLGFCYDETLTAGKSFKSTFLSKFDKEKVINDNKFDCNLKESNKKDKEFTEVDAKRVIAAIEGIKGMKATGLVIYTHFNHDYQVKFVKQIANAAAQENVHLNLYGAHSFDGSQLINNDNPDLKGLTIVTPAFGVTNLVDNFTKKFHEIYGEQLAPTWRDMMAYDAVKSIAYGLEEIVNDKNNNIQLKDLNNPSKQKEISLLLSNTLHSNKKIADGASREIRFNKNNGDRYVTPAIAQLQGKDGKYQFKDLHFDK